MTDKLIETVSSVCQSSEEHMTEEGDVHVQKLGVYLLNYA